MTEKGFTLVELIIAMGMGVFLMAGIVLTYRYQTSAGANLTLTVAVQQNLRAAMYHLEWDLRMAGADPTTGAYAATVPILVAENDRIAFSWDQDASGSIEPANEVVEYFLYRSQYLGSTNLQRREDGASRPVAQHIDALDFVYWGADARTPLPRPLNAENRRKVRRVQISLVGRSGTPLKLARIKAPKTFYNLQGDRILAARQDNCRRIQLNGEVTLRNRTAGQ